MNLEELRARLGTLTAANQAMLDKAATENRDLSESELTTFDANLGEVDKVLANIDRATRMQAAATGTGRRTQPDAVAGATAGALAARPGVAAAVAKPEDKNFGFRSFGEFAVSVQGHARGVTPDQRLLASQTTYGNEGTGTDGGFAVPPEFRTAIWQKVMDEDNLLTRCDQLTTSANSMTIPKDETTPWATTGGVQAYWEAEAASVTASKPALELATIRLAKLMALVPVSDELLEDASGLESWLRSKAPSKMAARINTAILFGTGVGQPLGILNSKSFISVAKETSQVAATLYFANIQKMWARMYAPCRRNAVWLINQDAEPQLNAMAFLQTASSPVPAYLPAGGLSVGPYATLMGRPVIPVEACQTIGTQGDIILADLTQYMMLTKGQNIQTDVSMHLYFDQALMAFRFIFRLNGQPWWGTAITPQNGSLTRSWAVTLDTRS